MLELSARVAVIKFLKATKDNPEAICEIEVEGCEAEAKLYIQRMRSELSRMRDGVRKKGHKPKQLKMLVISITEQNKKKKLVTGDEEEEANADTEFTHLTSVPPGPDFMADDLDADAIAALATQIEDKAQSGISSSISSLSSLSGFTVVEFSRVRKTKVLEGMEEALLELDDGPLKAPECSHYFNDVNLEEDLESLNVQGQQTPERNLV